MTGASQWVSTNAIGPQGQGYTGIGVTGQDVLIGGNLLVTGVIDPTNVFIVSGKTGGTSDPTLYISQTNSSASLLYEERYNQRYGITGPGGITAFRQSYYSKVLTPNIKKEYAQINITTPTVSTVNNATCTLDYHVTENSVLTKYFSISSSTATNSFFRTLNMNSYGITNATSITTPNASNYAPQKVEFLTGNTSTPAGAKDSNQRQVYFNAGVADSFLTISGSISPFSAPTCAENDNYNGITIIGTQDGYIFYTNDSGNTWTQYPYQFNGKITKIYHIGGGTNIIVGEFTNCDIQPVNYACYINNWSNYAQPYTWSNTGTIGFNAQVTCIEIINNWIYFGGYFTYDSGFSLNVQYIAIYDNFTNTLFAVDNSSGYGFNSPVLAMKNDSSNNGYLIIGGQFNYFNYGSGGVSCSFLMYWNVSGSGGYSTSSANSLVYLDNYPQTITQKDQYVLIGGGFSTAPAGSSQYAFKTFWDGINYQYENYYYNPTSDVRLIYNSPNANNIYTGEGGSGLMYKDTTLLGSCPSGVWNVVIYNQFSSTIDWFGVSGSAPNPYPLYYFFTSDFIQIFINNSVVFQGQTYTNYIYFTQIGQSVELLWDASNARWFVVGYTTAGFV